jgi:uncharacterized membrane protein
MFRPNYRRARALTLEIEAAAKTLDEARGDAGVTADQIDDLKAEIAHLRRELFMCGVPDGWDYE